LLINLRKHYDSFSYDVRAFLRQAFVGFQSVHILPYTLYAEICKSCDVRRIPTRSSPRPAPPSSVQNYELVKVGSWFLVTATFLATKRSGN